MTRLNQSWFWTERWQAMEAEADRDLVNGQFKTFDSIDEMLADLDALGVEPEDEILCPILPLLVEQALKQEPLEDWRERLATL